MNSTTHQDLSQPLPSIYSQCILLLKQSHLLLVEVWLSLWKSSFVGKGTVFFSCNPCTLLNVSEYLFKD